MNDVLFVFLRVFLDLPDEDGIGKADDVKSCIPCLNPLLPIDTHSSRSRSRFVLVFKPFIGVHSSTVYYSVLSDFSQLQDYYTSDHIAMQRTIFKIQDVLSKVDG